MAVSEPSITTLSLLVIILAASTFPATAVDDSGSSTLLPCVQKILPCQPYLKSPSSPPATCCIPLKDFVENDRKCACAIFNNGDLLRSFNVTQDDAMNLAKACNANADISICKTLLGGSPTSSPPASVPTNDQGGEGKSAAHGIKAFGGSVGLTMIVASVYIIITAQATFSSIV
ncbi:hypothetical protein SAY87_003311 [Trapa incisa]|uniref:Bifunctional inhibitor/plant lipid transfer protein/seed storage helical domain-containing protein n=1 Tax=Trapa incisa TaxID=236973 RepID=A0AAN7QL37_9MYRT|nr:hypothetical protein SAY87_003311 [Trapa incisa]